MLTTRRPSSPEVAVPMSRHSTPCFMRLKRFPKRCRTDCVNSSAESHSPYRAVTQNAVPFRCGLLLGHRLERRLESQPLTVVAPSSERHQDVARAPNPQPVRPV